MKKLLFTFFVFLSIASYAQASFEAQIKKNSTQLEKATSVDAYDSLFNEFSTLIKAKHPHRWQAYYYAGLTQYKKANLLLKNNDILGAREANSVAHKYITAGVDSSKPNAKELLQQIVEQKNKLQ